jgi:hypothetical protein
VRCRHSRGVGCAQAALDMSDGVREIKPQAHVVLKQSTKEYRVPQPCRSGAGSLAASSGLMTAVRNDVNW